MAGIDRQDLKTIMKMLKNLKESVQNGWKDEEFTRVLKTLKRKHIEIAE